MNLIDKVQDYVYPVLVDPKILREVADDLRSRNVRFGERGLSFLLAGEQAARFNSGPERFGLDLACIWNSRKIIQASIPQRVFTGAPLQHRISETQIALISEGVLPTVSRGDFRGGRRG